MENKKSDVELGKWFFKNKDGAREEVKPERWAWGVIYKDNTEMHQFDKDGIFHQIGEVDQSRVKFFVMYKVGPENKRVDIYIPEDAKIIHKYRNFCFNFGTPKEFKARIYVFGYKRGNATHLNYIMPDDNIIQSSEDIKLEGFFTK